MKIEVSQDSKQELPSPLKIPTPNSSILSDNSSEKQFMSETSSEQIEEESEAPNKVKKSESAKKETQAEDVEEAPALVKSGINLEVDMKLGWRPRQPNS